MRSGPDGAVTGNLKILRTTGTCSPLATSTIPIISTRVHKRIQPPSAPLKPPYTTPPFPPSLLRPGPKTPSSRPIHLTHRQRTCLMHSTPQQTPAHALIPFHIHLHFLPRQTTTPPPTRLTHHMTTHSTTHPTTSHHLHQSRTTLTGSTPPRPPPLLSPTYRKASINHLRTSLSASIRQVQHNLPPHQYYSRGIKTGGPSVRKTCPSTGCGVRGEIGGSRVEG